MDRKSIIRITQQFKKNLEFQGIRVQKIILFGSYANGNAHDGSDIDLVVLSDDFENKNYWERIDLLTEAIYSVFAPIEATALTFSEWDKGERNINEYAKNGEVIE
jgi:predicted nucleotidyltransferase